MREGQQEKQEQRAAGAFEMFVKICGTTNLADAQLAAVSGADALGFIFAASKRQVSVETAAEITRQLPGHVLLVGVFTQPDADAIVRTVSQARLTAVQMHWSYDPQRVEQLHRAFGGAVALWQVVGFQIDPSVRDEADRRFAQELRAALLDPRLACVLLDAVKGGASGGLGQAFSWDRAAALVRPLLAEARQIQEQRGLKVPHLVVAGGLSADNVHQAIEALQPWGVDVVSGVEASPGKKSPDRLRAFVTAVKSDGLG